MQGTKDSTGFNVDLIYTLSEVWYNCMHDWLGSRWAGLGSSVIFHITVQGGTSDLVLCVCFGGTFCADLTICVSGWCLVGFGWLSGRLLVGSCSFGLAYVLFVFWLIWFLVVSHFDFGGRTLVLIASVPGRCLSFTLYNCI